MPRSQMPLGDCLRALGLTPEASWDDIRQAYKDLVRVWHPDRFQSDPELRDRAQQHLQQINEAYLALKSARRFDAPPPPPPQPPPRPEPPPAAPSPSVPPRPQPRSYAFLWHLPLQGLVKIVALCSMPVIFLGVLMHFLRVPTLDSALMDGNLPRPAILTPSRMINPLDQPSVAAASLAAWAREGASLWRSAPQGDDATQRVATAARSFVEPSTTAPPSEARRPRGPAPAAVLPVNGTEMVWSRRSGEGELWITNDTDKDALVTLVQTRTTEPLRAVYVQAKNKVCVRNIAVGVDDLVAEVGDDWDPKQLRFRSGRHALGRSGPFNFFEVASAQGSAGRRYDAVLRTR